MCGEDTKHPSKKNKYKLNGIPVGYVFLLKVHINV